MKLREQARDLVDWNEGVASWNFPRYKYKVTIVWRAIWPKMDKVFWYKLVWTTLVVPKHAFITWLAILNRLPTKDRLKSWGMDVNGTFVLCKNEEETRDHLFFGCNFSRQIWKKVLQICGYSRETSSWTGELQWAIQMLKGKSLNSTILRLAWNLVIYFTWRERNVRIYKKQRRNKDANRGETKNIF